jgi:PAS domain S-box-containing protein
MPLSNWLRARSLRQQLLLAVGFVQFLSVCVLSWASVRYFKSLFHTVSLLVVTALLATLLIYFLATRLTQRLSRVTEASRQLAAGNLDINVEPLGSDELGQLADSLNTTARNLKARIDELNHSEERLALVVRASADGIWDWNLRTNEVYFAPRFRELLGYRDEKEFRREFLFSSALHPQDRERAVSSQAAHLLRRSENYDEEFRLRCRDGSYRWFRGRGQAMWDRDGKAQRFAGSIADIDMRKRTQELLQRREERLQYALLGASDGIWDWDIARNEYYLSPRFKELLGYLDDELPNDRSSFLEALHPEDRPRVEEDVRRHFERHTPYDNEYRLRRKDGSYRWFRGRGQAVWDTEGRVVRFSGTSSDISLQRQAQENIRSLLKEKQALLDNAVVGITHVRNRVILSCNRRFEEMLGYAEGELIGKTTEIIFPSRRIFEEVGVAAYATMGRGEHYSGEHELKRKDSSLFWGLITGRPLDPTKAHEGSIWIVTDVDERHKAMDALVREHNLSDALIGTMPAIFFLCDRSYRLVRWNDELKRRFGVPDRELSKVSVLDFFGPQDRQPAARMIDAAFEHGHQEAEARLQLRDASPYYLLTARPIEIDGATYAVGVGFDITDRKQAEQEVRRLNEQLERRVAERTAELEAANRELESFSYSVSHDLSAPLRGIDGFSRMLEEDFADKVDDNGKNYIHRIRAGTQRMQRLIDDLLSLSRVARDEMRCEQFDLSALAAEILGEIRNSQPSREVETLIAPNLTVTADQNLMRIAIENLLRNAWKFTAKHERAHIEVGVLLKDGKTVYFVRDDGAGFDMRYATKLFGPFQRMHRVSDFEGTGVGLAIVSRIIHRHGGQIWAEAVVEQGATFYFTLS